MAAPTLKLPETEFRPQRASLPLPDETVAEMIFCLSDNAVCTFGELCRR